MSLYRRSYSYWRRSLLRWSCSECFKLRFFITANGECWGTSGRFLVRAIFIVKKLSTGRFRYLLWCLFCCDICKLIMGPCKWHKFFSSSLSISMYASWLAFIFIRTVTKQSCFLLWRHSLFATSRWWSLWCILIRTVHKCSFLLWGPSYRWRSSCWSLCWFLWLSISYHGLLSASKFLFTKVRIIFN